MYIKSSLENHSELLFFFWFFFKECVERLAFDFCPVTNNCHSTFLIRSFKKKLVLEHYNQRDRENKNNKEKNTKRPN